MESIITSEITNQFNPFRVDLIHHFDPMGLMAISFLPENWSNMKSAPKDWTKSMGMAQKT